MIKYQQTTIFAVVTTWHDARFEVRVFAKEDEAEREAESCRKTTPEAFTLVRKIEQSLPDMDHVMRVYRKKEKKKASV